MSVRRTETNGILYLGGPMTGYKHYNFPLFWEVAQSLRAQGYVVNSPAEKEMGPDHLPDPAKMPIDWGGTNADLSPGKTRAEDFRILLTCRGMAMLPKWDRSWGTRREASVAQACGMPLYETLRLHNGIWALCKLPSSLVLDVVVEYRSGGLKDFGNTGLTELKNGG